MYSLQCNVVQREMGRLEWSVGVHEHPNAAYFFTEKLLAWCTAQKVEWGEVEKGCIKGSKQASSDAEAIVNI